MKRGFFKWALILLITGSIITGGIIYYMFNEPHRDIQASKTDYELEASDLVQEYLTNASMANDKYLQIEGNSKIIAVTGSIALISEDLNHQKVILIKEPNEKAGVSCTFTSETNQHTKNLKIGERITVKGVIRAGAGYDEDLELYEDVILEKCDILYN